MFLYKSSVHSDLKNTQWALICPLIGALSRTNDRRNLKYVSDVIAALLHAQLPSLKLKRSSIAEFFLAPKSAPSWGIRKNLWKCVLVGFACLFPQVGARGNNRLNFFRSILLQFCLFVSVVVWPLLWACSYRSLWQPVTKVKTKSWGLRQEASNLVVRLQLCVRFFCLDVLKVDVNQHIHQTAPWKSICQRFL